jgi:hypothetical protein
MHMHEMFLLTNEEFNVVLIIVLMLAFPSAIEAYTEDFQNLVSSS